MARTKAATSAASKAAATTKAAKKDPAKQVDKQLARYRSMRDFALTAEPSGSLGDKPKAAAEALPFVIQKHAATRLHYDFRLGLHGVLKSWAVTKGPSYYTGDKRLAVQVEDHPMDYGGFEGTIPKGQYGGGTVMLWDEGSWEPHGDADEGLRTGRLKFALNGKKLKGNWTLIRMGGRAAEESKPNWLLIKEHDGYERPADATPITEEAPDSVVTGRDLDGIAAAEDHVWQSHAAAKKSEPAKRSRLTRRLAANSAGKETGPAATAAAPQAAPDRESVLKDAPREKMSEFIAPQLASDATQAPEGEAWLHELKLDGYRIQAHIERSAKGGRKVTLYTRNGLDWTHRMPQIAQAAALLPVKAALLDGEVVVLDQKGSASFADLQAAFDEGAKKPFTYFIFDLLHLDGHNLRSLPLVRRKEILESLLGEMPEQETLRYSEHLRTDGARMFADACRLGAEGVVSKRADSIYVSGRSKSWLKAKCVHQQEFVIGGFTLPSKGGVGIGALLLGYYENGKLVYAGRTGTGFTEALRKNLRARLDEIRLNKRAFAHVPADGARGAIWVRPELVGEVHFASWTGDHMVRQAAFQGLREDKAAKEIVRENAIPVARPEKQKKSIRESAGAEENSAAKDTGAEEKSPTNDTGTDGKSWKEGAAQAERSAQKSAGGNKIPQLQNIHLTHPEKVLDQETQLTKLQLAEYYSEVADAMLPYIAHRPLSIVRCPEGSTKPCFFQKHKGMGLPKGVGSVPVAPKKGGAAKEYISISSREGLIGLAQMGVLEVHPWGSQNDALETPDRLNFDLDPDEAIAWERLVGSAFEVRDLLKQLGLESFVKLTGGKGLHVVAPIAPERGWQEVKEFAHQFVSMMEAANPSLYLTKMTKAARKNRIYLDYLRNERGATAVAPYSPRARQGARVSVPLSWKELKGGKRPEFAVANFAEWKSRLKRDPWKGLNELKQSITEGAVQAVTQFSRKAG
jgi:bifunctional non-homologous end joining protein LigD